MKLLFFLILFMSGLVNAEIPQTMSYQGVLTDASGTAVADGNFSLTFKLYESAAGGPLVWEETQGVTVSNGIFNAVLGSSSVLSLLFDKQYWLGIAVDGGSELQPRIQLTSAAYSLNARSVADSAVTGSTIANGSVVRSINSLTENVSLVAGENVTVANSGNTVVISTTEARLSIPFGGRVDEPTTLLSLSNDGLGAVAGFQIFNENSTAPVLDVVHRGLGVAGTFAVTKSNNPNPALQALTKGRGPGIVVEHEGSAGNLAEFKTPSGKQVTFSRDGNITAAGDVETGGKIVFADGTEQSTAAFGAGQSWSLTGNTNAGPDTAFIGTTDNLPFEIKVNNARGFRLEPAGSGQTFSPNVIGGFAGNQVTNGASGAAISGGGVNAEAHQISADFGAIGGGKQNLVSGRFGTVAGGSSNTSSGEFATVGGGEGNQAAAGIVGSADYGVIGGGKQNLVSGRFGTVSGGSSNTSSGEFATVGGGENNEATVEHATVAGGKSNRAVNFFTTISGGELNRASKSYGVIAGGQSNSTEAGFATVSGGRQNLAGAGHATVGGGELNIAGGDHATIGGGENNAADFFGDTVAGGVNNVARNVESGPATVGGGDKNQALNDYATVAGGQENTASGSQSFVGSGRQNLASGQYSTVAGGNKNQATRNRATIGGGEQNVVSGQAATVPGGDRNHARGNYSFAAGYKARAIHEGAFVWNDRSVTTGNDSLVSTANNQFLIRAAGGVGIGTNSPGFPLQMGSGAHVTTGGVWTNASSRAYKEQIANLSADEALSAFQNLNPVKYNYKNEKDEQYVGFIAEDVPELAATKDRKSLSPMDIVAIMTKVVQQQQAVISQLQERMAELEKR